MPSILERIDFPKIVTVLAAIFTVSLGLCGVDFAIMTLGAAPNPTLGRVLAGTGYLELLAMILSAAALILTLIAWIISGLIYGFQHKNSRPQKLFDKSEND